MCASRVTRRSNTTAIVIYTAAFAVIASGGVARLEDVDAIAATGASAAIVGRALYTGAVDLADAMARAAQGVALTPNPGER